MNNKTNLWIESNLITRQVNHVNDASSKAPSVLLLKFPVQKFQQIRLKKSTLIHMIHMIKGLSQAHEW